MRIRKRETAVAEPEISLLGMGWKQVEVQEEEEEEEDQDQDQPYNIDGEAAPAGSRAAVCSGYYNSDAMQQQQQQARGDQGSCKEHDLGSPVQQTLQLHYPDLVSREIDSGMGVGDSLNVLCFCWVFLFLSSLLCLAQRAVAFIMYSEVERLMGSRDVFQWSAQSTICRRRKRTMIRFMYICFCWERDGQVLSLFHISAAQTLRKCVVQYLKLFFFCRAWPGFFHEILDLYFFLPFLVVSWLL
jgi:hypothetical protein